MPVQSAFKKQTQGLLGTVLLAGSFMAAAVPPSGESPEDMQKLFTAANMDHVPVVFLNSRRIDLQRESLRKANKPSGLDDAIDSLIAMSAPGRQPAKLTMRMIAANYSNKRPGSVGDVYNTPGYDPATAVCVVFAEPLDAPDDSIVMAANGISLLATQKINSTFDFSKLTLSRDALDRHIKLHEGFHCIDPWYRTKIEPIGAVRPSLFSLIASSEGRLKYDHTHYRMEMFADVAATLKMAQEGSHGIAAQIAALRALNQTTNLAQYTRDPEHAAGLMVMMGGGQSQPQNTGWIDDIAYIPVSHLYHDTVAGLLAADRFIRSKSDAELQAMHMEDILNAAHEITDRASLSRDEFRGLSYALWDDMRDAFGKSKDVGIAVPEGIGLRAITPSQIEAGEKAKISYFQNIRAALTPFEFKPQNIKPSF